MSEARTSTFETRFASLEEASRSLSLEVISLSDALRIVAQIRQEQSAQRQRQDEADRALLEAKNAADVREARTRRVFGGVSLALAVLLPLVSILVYWALIQHVGDLLTAQKQGFAVSCQTRNQAVMDNARREQQLAEAETDARVKRIHEESAEALTKNIVDCSVYDR